MGIVPIMVHTMLQTMLQIMLLLGNTPRSLSFDYYELIIIVRNMVWSMVGSMLRNVMWP